MLLNLRYEWRLKSIEKYALDSLMGAGWERVSTVGFPRKTVVGFSVVQCHRELSVRRTFNSASSY
jgi:hypothetical protein